MQKFRVQFKLPDGSKLSLEVEAESHFGAANEAVFDADILGPLIKTGKTKFGARVVRCNDNVTRSVLVEVDGDAAPAEPERAPVPVATADDEMSDMAKVTIPDTGPEKMCGHCSRRKVPAGFEIEVPHGSVLCQCGLPVEQPPEKMEGWTPVEESQDDEAAVIEAVPDYREERLYRVHENPVIPDGLTFEQIACLRSNGLLDPVCDGCGDLATEEDDDGVPLCEDCYLECIEDEDEQDDPTHYLVIYGGHLEPGDPDRISFRVRAENPRIALEAAELAARDYMSPEWLAAFNQVGFTPTIDRCDPPEADRIKRFVDSEMPRLPCKKEYDVSFFCGGENITVCIQSDTPESAAVMAAIQEAHQLAPFVGASGALACEVNGRGNDETWGPDVVNIPVERVVLYGAMSPEQKRVASSRIGITKMAAGPAYDLGPGDPK